MERVSKHEGMPPALILRDGRTQVGFTRLAHL